MFIRAGGLAGNRVERVKYEVEGSSLRKEMLILKIHHNCQESLL